MSAAGLVAGWLLLGGGPARANGQVTHAWIAREAVGLLPDGPLRELLEREDLEPWLVHGAMFPDWGYAVDTVGGEGWERQLGEAAHWEPYQDALQAVLRGEGCVPPLDDPCAQAVAFALGLVAHGMSDQVFDGFLYGWSSFYDAELGWAEGASFDEASDVIWAAAAGAPALADQAVLPAPELLAAYEEEGYDQADEQVLANGVDLLRAAYDLVAWLATSGEVVEAKAADFPWGAAALGDPDVPGHPSHEALAVAGAWETWWARLEGAEEPDRVLLTWPPRDRPWGLATDPALPEARTSVVFTRTLDGAAFDPSAIRVLDAAGGEVPVDAWIFYGNVLHVAPLDPWREGEAYELVLPATLAFRDGGVLGEERRFAFQAGEPLAGDSGAGCGCGVAPGAGGGALGAGLLLLVGISGSRRAGRRVESG